MQFLRKALVFLASSSLMLLLLMTAATWTARSTIMDRAQVKAWLSESRLYDNFISEIANTFDTQQKQEGSEQTIDAVVVVRAAEIAFPPDVLRANVEKVLDGTYSWLEGSVDTLTFELNLEAEKKRFAEEIGNQALASAASLPPCPESQPLEDFDPFAATCIPSGANLSTEIEKIKTELLANEEFLGDTNLKAEDITLQNSAGEAVQLAEAIKDAPKAYQLLAASPWVFSLLSMLSSGIIIAFTRPRRASAKILAWLYGVPGVILLFTGLAQKLFNSTFTSAITSGSKSSGVAETLVVPLIGQINSSFISWNLLFGGLYLGVSVVAVIVSIKLHPDKSIHSVEQSTEQAEQKAGVDRNIPN